MNEREGKSYLEKVKETFEYFKKVAPFKPDIIITLGTGLASLGDRINKVAVFPYRELPNFPFSTVETHKGELCFGILEGKKVVVLQGRFHFYEGYSAKEITFPLRVLSLFKPKIYLVSNAAGGLNLTFKSGDLMLIKDHINLIPDNPLRGPNYEGWGPRFPDLSCAYDPELREIFKKVALTLGEEIKEGVYVAVPGPSLETPAETRFLRLIGADAVGMSTVPEVIVAVHAGLKVLGVSVISNVNDPDNFKPILFSEVVEQSKKAEKRLEKLIREFLKELKL
ncbi:purine-nucleoside phosphorylase [Thermodesulfobacterium sp. TA1]|uniref:purine-nucleoside phosphorylase n=1 Tax=Thermodesulfobacterium sp. TA1 TaxID=2234087 RepID=UPI001232DD92|nr:purine-nucleoside phosphorylase [Thermodesulfobacterium sp. TA1]QER41782.1 purine-nucleoside phosphorylase [Thermodesulfobacterium sp. TA1]